MSTFRLPESPAKPLDRWLREQFPERSWNEVRKWVRTGKVFVNGKPLLEPAAMVPGAAEVSLRQSAPRPDRSRNARAARLPQTAFLYVDQHVVVVEKPAGISTVPYDESERGTLDELVREALAEKGKGPPLGIVHRIDKETSGVVVFARSPVAQRALKQQFRFHTTGRRYLALAHGPVAAATFRSRIVKDRGDGRRGSTENPKLGRDSVTHVRPLEPLRGATLVECRLETGRTHQIRIHLSEAGHPLVGERVYSKNANHPLIAAPRLMLHAEELAFEHPHNGQRLTFSRPAPDDMQQMLSELRKRR